METKQHIGKKDIMVGTKTEIIAQLQEMFEIADDETIMLDLWTMSDVRAQSETELADDEVIDIMKAVHNDLCNESTIVTVEFAINNN